jgi:CDP-4-dehydro-6-deoxyglucose reductase
VPVSGPYGTFIGDPAIRGPVLAVCGGSGLAPILALTDAALSRGYPDPVTLLFSARTSADVYARGLIDYWAYRYSNFRYLRTITDMPGPEIPPPTGFIPDILDDLVEELSGTHVFIAGAPAFVAACRAAALRHGAAPERVHVENYFPQEHPEALPEPVGGPPPS